LASGLGGADVELCARRRAAALADRDAPQVPDHAHTKISNVVSDLLAPARVVCCALSATVQRIQRRSAAPADQQLRATFEQLRDAFGACTDLIRCIGGL
jgi:hypothetical protein